MRISSDKQLPKLPPGEHPIASVPGMTVRVSPQGRRSFRLRYRVHPEPRQHSMPLGRYPDISLRDASSQARAALGAAVKGVDPGADIRKARSKTAPEYKFTPLVDRYSNEWCVKNQKPKTADGKLKLLHREWGTKAKFANLDVRKITPEMVVAHLSVISDRGHHDANALADLKALFFWLHGKRIVKVIPTDGVRHNSKAKPRSRYLNHDELRIVWAAADQTDFPFGHVVKLLLLTATRRLEVGGMCWSEIDYSQREWTIPHERTKKHRDSLPQPHLIPLSQPAIDVLQSIPKVDETYVFPGKRGDKHLADWDARKKNFDALCGIPKWGLHDLRRTVITELGRLRVPPHIKRAILHHSTRDVMDLHYDKFEYIDEKRDALDKWAKHLMGIAYEHPISDFG